MIAKAIKEEHPRPRPLHLTVEHCFKGYPFLSMLVTKIGGVPAHPANVHRLLHDEQQLVLVFPEGAKGTEKLYKDRYKLRRFGRGGFVEAAARARRADRAGRGGGRGGGDADVRPGRPAEAAHRPHLLPRDAVVPASRAARRRLPARPSSASASSRRCGPTAWTRRPGGSRAAAGDRRRDPRGGSRTRCFDMSAGGGPCGWDDARRVLITGLSTYWGGRLAQALERDPAVETVIGVGPERPHVRARPHGVRPRRHPARAAAPHRPRGGDRHGGGHAADRRLDARPARVAHENNVIGTMNILAACGGADSPVRKVVFKSSAHYYGSERDDPAFFTEDMDRPHPPRTPLERDIVEAERAVRGFAERDRVGRVTVLRFANALGPDRARATPRCSRCRPCRRSSASTRATSSSTRTTSRRARARRRGTICPGIYNAAGDGVLALSEVAGLLGKPCAGPAAVGDRTRRRRLRRLGLRIPPEMLHQLRYGRGLDNRQAQGGGLRFRATSREAVLAFAEHLACARIAAARTAGYRYEREVEEFLRWSPSVRGGDRLGAGPPVARAAAPSWPARWSRSGGGRCASLAPTLEAGAPEAGSAAAARAAATPVSACRPFRSPGTRPRTIVPLLMRPRLPPHPRPRSSSSRCVGVGAVYAVRPLARGPDRRGRDRRRRRRRRAVAIARPAPSCAAQVLDPLEPRRSRARDGKRFRLTPSAPAIAVDVDGTVDAALGRSPRGQHARPHRAGELRRDAWRPSVPAATSRYSPPAVGASCDARSRRPSTARPWTPPSTSRTARSSRGRPAGPPPARPRRSHRSRAPAAPGPGAADAVRAKTQASSRRSRWPSSRRSTRDRSSSTGPTSSCTLYKNLKLAKTYGIAVGAGRLRDAGRAVRGPEQGGQPGVARARLGLGGRPGRHR